MNRKNFLPLIMIASLSLFPGCQSSAQPEIVLTEYAAGLNQPVDIRNAGDKRLFVVEREGMIRIIDSSGTVLSTPFLNIKSRVVSSGSEQGLLGLAFHPNYKSNGYFFVNYIGTGDSTHISRFSVSGINPDQADPASEVGIFTVKQPYSNHNGGCLQFGPDNYLYFGLGDGGSGGDPGDRAQDSSNALGKLHRIDVNSGIPYGIPPTNPFIGMANVLPEIWALGLRNPWRFSFDRATGDLWIADVGQNKWEEIDFQSSLSTGGENYGWRCYEAQSTYNASGCLPTGNYVFPVHSYPNTGFIGDCSITGGYRYRGSQNPNLDGFYFFSDYCGDELWALYDSSSTWQVKLFGIFSGNNFSTFGEDRNGELYVAGLSSGKIYRIEEKQVQQSVREFVKESSLIISPNPVENKLQLILSGDLCLDAFNIYDISGRLIMAGNSDREIREVDTSQLRKGTYIISFFSGGNEMFRRKVVKN